MSQQKKQLLNVWQKLWLIIRKYKNEPFLFFDILMAITLRVNMITRKMTDFFSYTLWAPSIGIFHFCILRPSTFNSWDPPFALCSDLQNMYLHGKNDTFKSVNIDILFLHKNLQTFDIDHVFAQFDGHGLMDSRTFGSCERIYFFLVKLRSKVAI